MPIAPCTPSTVTRGIVTFDPTIFKGIFPEFDTVADPALSQNFAWATIMLNNGCCSRVQDAVIREAMLNQLTAHITALNQGVNGEPPQGIVGRVNAVAQGSVNVSSEFNAPPNPSQAYFIQTKYGALYWQMTLPWRSMQYQPAPQALCVGPFTGYGGIGPIGNGDCGNNGGSA